MENKKVENHYHITLNCKGKCPKCDEGELLPFLNAVYKKGYNNPDLDRYEVFYRCSACNYKIEGDSVISGNVVY